MFCLCHVSPYSQIQVFGNSCDCWKDVFQAEVLLIQIDGLNWKGVDWTVVCRKGHQVPTVFSDLENTHFSLTACWVQLDSVSCRCPFHMIDWSFVMFVSCDFDPFVIFILEHANFLLEASHCDQLSKLRIGPGYFPYCSFVSE